MKALVTILLTLFLAALPVAAAPKSTPPAAPPKGKVKLRNAKATPPGAILKLKPGQKRLTPEQLKLVLRKAPVPAPKKRTPAKGKKTGR